MTIVWTNEFFDAVAESLTTAPFTPDALFPISFWQRADVGLFQDAALTVPVTAAGQPIGGETDQSAAAHPFTQATSGKRPLMQTPLNNDQETAGFDGVDDCLQSAAGAIGTVSGLTWLVYGQLQALPVNAQLFGASRLDLYNVEDQIELMVIAGHWFAQVFHDNLDNPTVTGATADLAPHEWVLRWESGGLLELFIDGALVGSAADAGPPLDLAGKAEIGSRKNGTAIPAQVDVMESFCYPFRLSDTQLSQAQGYGRGHNGIYPTVNTTVHNQILGFTCGTFCPVAGGDLVGVYQDGSSDGSNDTTISLIRSFDRGATWSAGTPLISDPDFGCNVNVGMLQLADGRVLLPWYRFDEGGEAQGVFIEVSHNEGHDWPDRVTVPTPAGYENMFSYGRMVETSPGGELWLPVFAIHTADGRFDAMLLKAPAVSGPWTLKSVAQYNTIAPDSWTEWTMVRTGPGHWRAWFRNQFGGGLFTATSADDADTWTTAVSADPAFTGVAATPDALFLPDGVLLVIFVDRLGGSRLTCLRSLDGGASYGDPFVLVDDSGQVANPTLLAGLPKQIAVMRGDAGENQVVWTTFGEANVQ